MIKRIILSIVAIIGMVVFIPYSVAYAQDAGDAVCDTLGQATGNSCASVEDSGTSISDVVEGALNLLTFIAGVATVIMVIIGGVKYVTSRGDSTSVANAKGTILYALIGVVIVVLSQTIIFFLVGG